MGMLEVVPYISFFTFGLGLLFCIYLLIRFIRDKPIWFLIFLILCLSFTEFYMYALNSKFILQMPILFRSAFPARMLFGPLLYMYINSMLYPEKQLKIFHFLHFVPTLIVIGFLFPDYVAPNSYKLAVLNNFYEQHTVFISQPVGIVPPGVLQPFVILYGGGYGLASIWKIWKYKKSVMYQFATNSVVVHWLSLFPMVLLIYVVCQLIQYLSLSVGGQFSSWTQVVQSVSLLGLMGYLLIDQDIIENMDGCLNKNHSAAKLPLLPIPKVHLHPTFVEALDQYVDHQKPFLDPNFALYDLAKHLGQNPKKLSLLLNQTYGLHFNEWVNRHRIHYLIEIIKQENFKNLKLEALIYQSGFQYRSSFYLAFKKIMNNTPSAFFKEMEKTL
jgi:AraC-like DNA-binding protein